MPEAERLEQEPRFKVWRTVTDDKTRDSHILANGQVRFVGEPFKVGDAALSEPRDPDGPPEETYNCRCLKEEFTLSDLPKELLPQIEGRLTERQRLLLQGVRVADAGDELPDGLLSEEELADKLSLNSAKLFINHGIKTRSRNEVLAGKFGRLYSPEETIELVGIAERELSAIEKRGFGGLGKGVILIPQEPNPDPNNPFRQGVAVGNKISIALDITEEDVQKELNKLPANTIFIDEDDKQIRIKNEQFWSAFARENNLSEEALEAYIFRHELGHALVRLNGFLDENTQEINPPAIFTNPKTKRDLANSLSIYSGRSPNEAFAEAFAWYTSPDYPGADPSHPDRLPDDIVKALEEIIARQRSKN